jgi:hypothetical protein
VREPERLLSKGATDFERKLLTAVQGETPSPELELRMQRALGLTDASLVPTGGIAPAKASGALGLKLGLLACVGGGLLFWGLSRPSPGAVGSSQPARAAVPGVADVAEPASPGGPVPRAVPAPGELTPRSVAAAARVAEPGTGVTLREEIALLDRVRAAASRGDQHGARAALSRYRTRFPDGVLRAEANILSQRLQGPSDVAEPLGPSGATPSEAASRR